MSVFDFILQVVPRSARVRAISVAAEVEVTIGENDFGGWSIYAANDAARRILGGDEPTGNFGTPADAWRRASNDNLWRVVEVPTLPGFRSERRPCAA